MSSTVDELAKVLRAWSTATSKTPVTEVEAKQLAETAVQFLAVRAQRVELVGPALWLGDILRGEDQDETETVEPLNKADSLFFWGLPSPPPGGGTLVLTPTQFANKELRDETKVVESTMLPTGEPT